METKLFNLVRQVNDHIFAMIHCCFVSMREYMPTLSSPIKMSEEETNVNTLVENGMVGNAENHAVMCIQLAGSNTTLTQCQQSLQLGTLLCVILNG